MIGRVLSHYRIMSQLGAGGMGEVYVAEDLKLQRRVALKVLPERVSTDPQHLQRFRREARAVAALNNPHIVTIYSIEEADDTQFITMELIEGQTLAKVIPPAGMDFVQILTIGLALCDALHSAHTAGVIHRDLKPENIMVDKSGNLKILDFGLAKFDESINIKDAELRATITQTNSILGTFPYMAPELLQGQTADARTDIFALGVVLYRMATGKLPFSGNTPAEIFSSILRDQPQSISKIRSDLPSDFLHLVDVCLQKLPARRFQSVNEILIRLQNLKSSQPPKTDQTKLDSNQKISAIAVLPLVNLSGVAEEDYFADGMTDALIIDLAKACPVKVISRTSVMLYKNTKKSLNEIANELRVDAIVEGSIFRGGDRIRITAQLVRVDTAELLWAERYDRKLEDVLVLQDEVVRAITHEINRTLNIPAVLNRNIERKIDPDVYLLVLRGWQALDKRTEASFRTAFDFFQKAIDIDPTYAPAYIGVADSQNMLANYGFVQPAEIVARSLAAVRKALELDEDSADAHRVLAFIHWQFQFAWNDAISEYERSLELDPNSALSNYFYGVYLGVIGFFRKAEIFLKHAEEKDPLSLVIPSVQGWICFFERRFEDALPYFNRVLAIDSNYHLALWFLGETLVEMGRYKDGIESLENALRLSGETSRLLGYTGYAYGRSGQKDKAREILLELEARKNQSYVPPYFLALVYCGLDESDRALDLLEYAFATKDTMIRDLKADAQWDQLCTEPRFQQLMQAMAYPTPPDKPA